MVSRITVVIGVITLLLLSSGAVYLTFSDTVRFRIDDDQSTFYTKSVLNRYVVSGREQNRLFDGTSQMNRDLSKTTVDTDYDEETGRIVVQRQTHYIRGPVIIDTYKFDGSVSDISLFPMSHQVRILNGKGYFYRYTVDDLTDTGGRRKLTDETLLSFGRNMKVQFPRGYRWAHVGWPYGSDSFSAQYDIPSNDVTFNVRLFDPPGGRALQIPVIRESNNTRSNNSERISTSRGDTNINMSLRAIILGNEFDHEGRLVSSSPRFTAPARLSAFSVFNFESSDRNRNDWEFTILPRHLNVLNLNVTDSNTEFVITINANEPLVIEGSRLLGEHSMVDFSDAEKEYKRYTYGNLSERNYTFAEVVANESLQRGPNITGYEVRPQKWDVVLSDLGGNVYEANLTLNPAYSISFSDVIYIDPTVVISDPSNADNINNITNEQNYSHLELINNSIIFYFPFDRSSSSSTEDWSSNQYTASYGGSASISSGVAKYGKSLNLSGGSDSIQVASSTSIGHGNSGTISAWVRPDSAEPAYYTVMSSKTDGTEEQGIEFWIDENNGADLTFGSASETYALCESVTWAADTWYHVAVSWSGTSAAVYLDGTDCTTDGTISAAQDSTDNNMLIGSRADSENFFTGYIDEVYFHEEPLSASEISAMYEGTRERFETQGFLEFRELNLSSTGQENKVSISINQTLPISLGENFTVQIGSSGAGDYTYGTIYQISTSTGEVSGMDLSTPNNASVKILAHASNASFLSPLLEDSFTITSTAPQDPTISFVPPTPSPFAQSLTDSIYINLSSNDSDGTHSTFLNFQSDVLYYQTFEIIDATKLSDSSGYSLTDTVSGDTVVDSDNGYFGNGSTMDASESAHINVTDWDIDPNATGSFSAFAWGRIPSDATGNQPLIQQSDGTGAAGRTWLFISTANGGRFQTNLREPGGSGMWDTSNDYADSQWHHFGVVWNGSDLELFVDGVNKTREAKPSGLEPSDGILIIGNGKGYNQNLNGSIDDIIFFNRSLERDEIKALYDSQTTQYENNFTGLPNDQYQYKGCIMDTDGNLVCTNLRTTYVINTTVISFFDALSSFAFRVTDLVQTNSTITVNLQDFFTNITLSTFPDGHYYDDNGTLVSTNSTSFYTPPTNYFNKSTEVTDIGDLKYYQYQFQPISHADPNSTTQITPDNFKAVINISVQAENLSVSGYKFIHPKFVYDFESLTFNVSEPILDPSDNVTVAGYHVKPQAWVPTLEILDNTTASVTIVINESYNISFGDIIFLDPKVTLFSGGAEDVAGNRIFSFNNITHLTTVDANTPELYWAFDYDTIGSFNAPEFVDYSGNGLHGTLIDSPTIIDGYVNGALDVTDNTDGAVITNGADEIEGFTAITMSAWINRQGVAGNDWGRIISKQQGPASDDYALSMVGNSFPSNLNKIACRINTNTGTTTAIGTTAITGAGWRHVACTWDGSNVRIYVDGSLETTVARTGTLDNSNDDFAVGLHPGTGGTTRYFNGYIDEVRIYDSALATAQINDLANEDTSDLGPTFESNGTAFIRGEARATNQTRANLTLINDYDLPDDANFTIRLAEWGIGSGYVVNGDAIFYVPLDNNGVLGESTSVVSDISGNFNGTPDNGAAPITNGRYNDSYVFDGTDDSINFGDHTGLEGLSAFSMSAWVQKDTATTTANRGVFSKGTCPGTGCTGGITWDANENYLCSVHDTGGTTVTATSPTADTSTSGFKHIVCVYNSTNTLLYENGVLTAVSAVAGVDTTQNNANQLVIGASTPAAINGFSGFIDEAMILDRVMTADEVWSLYATGSLDYETNAGGLSLTISTEYPINTTNGANTTLNMTTKQDAQFVSPLVRFNAPTNRIYTPTFFNTQIELDYYGGPPEPEDTCTYTSGNWLVACSDNCQITNNVDGGGNELRITGTGLFTVDGASITNFIKKHITGTSSTNRCTIRVLNGGKF